MSRVNIDNPVINSPFEEPRRHFKEITDPWNIQNTIREFMSEYAP